MRRKKQFRYILRLTNGHHAALPQYPGGGVVWNEALEPWTFQTKDGADRARLLVNHLAKVVKQELVA